MALGVAFDGMLPMVDMLDLARRAEARGVRSLWMAEHMGYRDGVAGSMALLAATRGCTVAPTAISVYSRHPMIVAMTAATLEECGPGRTLVVLATGNPRALGELGLDVTQPLVRMHEYVTVLRELYTGKPVTFEGQVFRLKQSALHVIPERPIPVWIAAMGPRMLALAGQVADGVLLSAALSPMYIRHSLGLVRAGAVAAGRNPSAVAAAGFVLASVGRDAKAARHGAKRMLAYLCRNRFVAENLEMTGSRIDRQAAADAAAGGDWDTATSLIPDDEVARYAVVGTPEECGAQLTAFRTAGLDTPILLAIGDLESRRLAIEVAREPS